MFILKLSFKKIKNEKIISNNFKINNNKNFGIYKIKKKKKIFTLLKSPHVNKKALEHFEYSYHIQKLDLKFNSLNELFNLLIFIKKTQTKNCEINIKIINKQS